MHELILDQFFFLQNNMNPSLLNLMWPNNLSSKTCLLRTLKGSSNNTPVMGKPGCVVAQLTAGQFEIDALLRGGTSDTYFEKKFFRKSVIWRLL